MRMFVVIWKAVLHFLFVFEKMGDMYTPSPLRVVCFGGGTGLPSLLSGLKHDPLLDLTAIVSMFDNGGSSGVLRDRFGILPPSDILRCLLALSKDEEAARNILSKRIQHSSMPGHTGGNLLLLALETVYGNYLDAVAALGEILSVQGRVVPVTLERATLGAHTRSGKIVHGEVQVDVTMRTGEEIADVFIEPQVSASRVAIEAIEATQAICVSPGSLYTSVLPNFLPDAVRVALCASTAPMIFMANLLTEGRGMRGFTIPKIVHIAERVIGRSFEQIIFNTRIPNDDMCARYAAEEKYPLLETSEMAHDSRYMGVDLWMDETIARHDSLRLARAVSLAIDRLCRA